MPGNRVRRRLRHRNRPPVDNHRGTPQRPTPPVANDEHNHRRQNRRGPRLSPRQPATSTMLRPPHRRATHRRLPSTACPPRRCRTRRKPGCHSRSCFRLRPHRTRSRRTLQSRPASSNRSPDDADPSSTRPQHRLPGLKSPRMTRPCSRPSPGLPPPHRVDQRPGAISGHWRIVQAKSARPTHRPTTGRQPPQRQARSDQSSVPWGTSRRRHRHTKRPLLSHRPSRQRSLARQSHWTPHPLCRCPVCHLRQAHRIRRRPPPRRRRWHLYWCR